MKAMLLTKLVKLEEDQHPLVLREVPVPEPGDSEVRIRIAVCGVCHTELDIIEGRTPPKEYPLIPGHQAVGVVEAIGPAVSAHRIGDRVGVAWIFSACGNCRHCLEGMENLCDQFEATGRDVNGGYAEYMTAPENYVYPIPDFFSDVEAAPLLCAGAIGYRSLKLTGITDGDSLGLMGFGASAHLVLKLVKYQFPSSEVLVFARKEEERRFSKDLGAIWAGDIADRPPKRLNAIIDTTPVWKPIVEALGHLKKGGRLVINAIRKESTDQSYLQKLSYADHLWEEKEIKSVANVTAEDVKNFLEIAAKAGIKPHVKEYPLESANHALMELRNQKIKGAKVLRVFKFS